MKLYRDFILASALRGVEMFRTVPGVRGLQRVDFEVTAAIAAEAQTILFSADQALALRPALAEFDDQVTHRLPFRSIILQFDRPIPEHEFFETERADYQEPEFLRNLAAVWRDAGLPLTGWTPEDGDAVTAVLLTQGTTTDTGKTFNQAVAFFVSTAVNRAYWRGTELLYLTGVRDVVNVIEDNKRTLRNLAVACVAYMNCVNLQLEKHEPPAAIQKRRRRDNKPPIPAYYTVTVRPEYRRDGDGSGEPGSKHSYRYDVRGHFRRLADGRLTWVRPHQRGLAHEQYIPAVRKVKP